MKKDAHKQQPTKKNGKSFVERNFSPLLLLAVVLIFGLLELRGLLINTSPLRTHEATQRAQNLQPVEGKDYAELVQHAQAIDALLDKMAKEKMPENGAANTGPVPKEPEPLAKRLTAKLDAVNKDIEAQQKRAAGFEQALEGQLRQNLVVLAMVFIFCVIDFLSMRNANRALEKDEVLKEYRAKSARLDDELRDVAEQRRKVHATVDAEVQAKLAAHEAEMRRQKAEAEETVRKAGIRAQEVEKAAAELRHAQGELGRAQAASAEQLAQAQLLKTQSGRDVEKAEAERKRAGQERVAVEHLLPELRALAGFVQGEMAQYLLAHPDVAKAIGTHLQLPVEVEAAA